jgi:hypothetical protein
MPRNGSLTTDEINKIKQWINEGANEEVSTSGENELQQPDNFKLLGNYPNPFNPTTTFNYDIAKASAVRLQVFDVLGRQVAELVNERKAPGSYTVNFDASNLSSGMYIYRMQAGSNIFTQKMTLIK